MKRVVLMLLMAALGAWAQGGLPLVQIDPFLCFTRVDGGTRLQMSIVNVEGPGFTRAWNLKSLQGSANAWDLRLRCFETRAVRKGDGIVASFWIRTITPARGLDKGAGMFVFEKGAEPYTKSAQVTAFAGSEWQRVDIPFYALEDYPGGLPANTYNLGFWVNYEGQEIQIGGFTILNYGAGANFQAVPLANWPYGGRAADAPWRAAAAERIDKYRKSDVTLVVRGVDGEAVAGAPLKVRMKRHAFGFGSAVAGNTLRANETYRRKVIENFNHVVLENDLKWPGWERSHDAADFALSWLPANGIPRVRGHNMIWPGRANLPVDVQAMLSASSDAEKAALRARIDAHLRSVGEFTRGRVTEWDVINEPVTNKDVMTVLGDEEMIRWFRIARETDPDVKLYLNDYNIVEAGGGDLAHINSTWRIMRFLQDAGAPVDGLGLQCHFAAPGLTSMDRVWELLEQWAGLGVDLQVTEFDVSTGDEQVQADYTRDFLTMVFSHPRINAFLMWGFWEGAHWRPEAAMLRRDWSEKPNYQVWRDLVYGQWWTNVDGVTDAAGAFGMRGFLGDYEVEYEVGGVSRTASFTLKAGENVVELR